MSIMMMLLICFILVLGVVFATLLKQEKRNFVAVFIVLGLIIASLSSMQFFN